MKRGLLWVALLLSAGFNLGVLASLVRDRPAAAPAPALDEPARAAAAEPVSAPAPVTMPEEPAPAEAGVVGSALQPAVVEPDADEAPRAPRPEARADAELSPLVDRLGLVGERRAEFVRLQQALAQQVRAMQPRIARARADLYRELSAPEPDRQRIEQRIAFLGRASSELERAFAETALRSRELLDPQQEQLYLRVLSQRLRMARDARFPPDGRGAPNRPRGARPRRP